MTNHDAAAPDARVLTEGPSAEQAMQSHPDQLVNATTRLLLDRRNLLRIAGMVSLAGGGATVLAACAPAQTPAATPSSAAPSSAAPSSAAPSSAAPSSAAPSSAAPSKAASSAPAPTGPSVSASKVPVGSGLIMDEPNDYVVTQPTKGE